LSNALSRGVVAIEVRPGICDASQATPVSVKASVCNPEKAVTWREIYLSVDDPDERQPS